jgi:hypothetical protein
MGILDDAIREHLDLKRRLGAPDDEVARLEGEAFGPPSRPGDPDFPEQPPTGESPVAEATATPAAADDAVEAPQDETQVFFDADADVEPAEPEPVAEAPAPEAPAEPAPPEPEVASAEPEPTAAEPVTGEQPSEDPVPLARELRAITDQPAEPATGESEIRPEDELDLDLDIDLDEPEMETEPEPEPAPAEPPVDEPVEAEEVEEVEAAVEPTPTPEREQPPISSFDTVEHHFEDAIEDTGDIEVVEGEVADEPLTGEEPVTGEEPLTGEEDQLTGEEEDEDVLEETPEFLREKPEDDELWFEQGSPKDFDF